MTPSYCWTTPNDSPFLQSRFVLTSKYPLKDCFHFYTNLILYCSNSSHLSWLLRWQLARYNYWYFLPFTNIHIFRLTHSLQNIQYCIQTLCGVVPTLKTLNRRVGEAMGQKWVCWKRTADAINASPKLQASQSKPPIPSFPKTERLPYPILSCKSSTYTFLSPHLFLPPQPPHANARTTTLARLFFVTPIQNRTSFPRLFFA